MLGEVRALTPPGWLCCFQRAEEGTSGKKRFSYFLPHQVLLPPPKPAARTAAQLLRASHDLTVRVAGLPAKNNLRPLHQDRAKGPLAGEGLAPGPWCLREPWEGVSLTRMGLPSAKCRSQVIPVTASRGGLLFHHFTKGGTCTERLKSSPRLQGWGVAGPGLGLGKSGQVCCPRWCLSSCRAARAVRGCTLTPFSLRRVTSRPRSPRLQSQVRGPR